MRFLTKYVKLKFWLYNVGNINSWHF